MDWKLEVEDVACPVDDMKTMDVFTFLRSESEGMVFGEEKKGSAEVQIDGRVKDADAVPDI
jgi:hypothetical protein